MLESGAQPMEKAPEASARPRVVLLGASNAALGLRAVVEAARSVLGGPLEVMGAVGLGRSYGAESRVLLRSLPGIAGCGLWESLRALPPAPTWALITDVGNDILFGAPPETIAAWVEGCLERLAGARVAMTLLPLETIRSLKPLRYAIARSLLYPGCRLSLEEALRRVMDVDRRLEEIAARRGIVPVRPEAGWYGIDAIHIRRRHRPRAWREVLSSWAPAPPARPLPPLGGWPPVLILRPQRFRLAGVEVRSAQPALRLSDGTTIDLF